MSTPRPFLVVPAFLGTIALARSPDAQSDWFSEESAEELAWPEDLGGLAKGRMVAGDVTGDLLPDAVLLDGGRPVIVYGPAIYRAIFPVDIEANDVAVPRHGDLEETDETRAGFVVVNSQGAWILTDYDGGSFDSRLLDAPTWAGAKRVAVADTDGDGFHDLVGLSASGALLVLENLREPNPDEIVLPMPAEVLDFVPVDWGESGESIAVLRTDGFFVLRRDGTALYSVPGAPQGGILAPLRQPNFPHERCALVFSNLGLQFLVVLDGSVEPEEPLPLGAAGVFGASAADADGDGYEDLYLVHTTSHETALLINRSASGPATFDPGEVEFVDVAPDVEPPPTWSAWPSLFDFSLDGDPDILLFVEATDAFAFLENASLSVEPGQVLVHGGSYVLYKNDDVFGPHGELGLVLEAPAGLPFEPTHVQVIGWVQADADSGMQLVGPTAVSNDCFALNAQGKTKTRIRVPENALYTPNIYHFDLRAVRVEDPQRGPLESGPPAVHAFTTPMMLVEGLEADFGPGTPLRTAVIGSGRPRSMRELDGAELVERALAPKEVKTPKIPLIDFPPDPF